MLEMAHSIFRLMVNFLVCKTQWRMSMVKKHELQRKCIMIWNVMFYRVCKLSLKKVNSLWQITSSIHESARLRTEGVTKTYYLSHTTPSGQLFCKVNSPCMAKFYWSNMIIWCVKMAQGNRHDMTWFECLYSGWIDFENTPKFTNVAVLFKYPYHQGNRSAQLFISWALTDKWGI